MACADELLAWVWGWGGCASSVPEGGDPWAGLGEVQAELGTEVFEQAWKSLVVALGGAGFCRRGLDRRGWWRRFCAGLLRRWFWLLGVGGVPFQQAAEVIARAVERLAEFGGEGDAAQDEIAVVHEARAGGGWLGGWRGLGRWRGLDGRGLGWGGLGGLGLGGLGVLGGLGSGLACQGHCEFGQLLNDGELPLLALDGVSGDVGVGFQGGVLFGLGTDREHRGGDLGKFLSELSLSALFRSHRFHRNRMICMRDCEGPLDGRSTLAD